MFQMLNNHFQPLHLDIQTQEFMFTHEGAEVRVSYPAGVECDDPKVPWTV